MSHEENEFRDLIQRVSDGSEEAAWQLVQEHGEAIRRAVRRALNKRLRSKFDSLDFVQLVWSSFFRARGNIDRFQRPEELVAFLVQMTRNKVGMELRRRLQTDAYDLNREQSLDELSAQGQGDTADRTTPPEDLAIARERFERMVQDKPEHHCEIVRMKLEGHSTREIAEAVGLSESAVRRFLDKLFDETFE